MTYDDYRRSGRDWDDRYGPNRGWNEDRDSGRRGRREMGGRARERNLGYDRPDFDRAEWGGRDREVGRGNSDRGYADRDYPDRDRYAGHGSHDDREYDYRGNPGYGRRIRDDIDRDFDRARDIDRERDMGRPSWDRGRDSGYRGHPADRADFDRGRGGYVNHDRSDRGWGLDRDYGNGEWGRGSSRDWDRDRDTW